MGNEGSSRRPPFHENKEEDPAKMVTDAAEMSQGLEYCVVLKSTAHVDS